MTPLAAVKIPNFRRKLLAWYDEHKRDLPWRRTRDPYAIWLSEMMLQQTTVRTVEPRWTRFLERWPTLSQLAKAPLEDVLHEWTGLGYYARARNLHKAAQAVAKDFKGILPNRYELLLALPGMGPYTAAAVASIAFEQPHAVVDANVERVLSRIDARKEEIRSAGAKKALKKRAGDLLSQRRPGDFNQAMMELGATLCLPKTPQCHKCPVQTFCEAKQLGEPEKFPVLPKKDPMKEVREAALIVQNDEKYLVLLRPQNSSFGGMWETPRIECKEDEATAHGAVRAAQLQTGLTIKTPKLLLRLKHVVMRKKINLNVFKVTTEESVIESDHHEDYQWVTLGEWADLPKSTTQADLVAFLADGTVPKKAGAKKKEAPEQADLFDGLD
jgi:A/G-specific adenine glycosylase